MVEIPAKDEVHPFQVALDEKFPELRFYKDKLPEQYPHEISLQRQAELKENRRTKVYLRIMEEEEAKKIRECFSRGKSAPLLRKETNKRIKEGGSLPFLYWTPSAVAGVTDNKQVQTYPSVAVAGTQMDHVVVLTSGEAKQLALTMVVQVPGVPAVTARTSLQEKISFSSASDKLYDVTSLDSRMALTKEQLASRKKSDPELKVKSKSLSATQKFQLRTKIRRRISRKYREHRNESRVKVSQRQHPQQGPISKSSTMIRMIKFFMAEIREKGDQGLPVWMEDYDPSYPEEEWAYKQKSWQLMSKKPENYEEILKVQLHDGTFNRKKKNLKKKQVKEPENSVSESENTDCHSQYSFKYLGLPTESSQESEEEQITFKLVPGTPISF